MLVTNYSEHPHRYVEPGVQGDRYYWNPGETKEVPDGVGQLMRAVHPSKFVQRYNTTEMVSPATTEMVAFRDCAGRTKADQPCKRRAGISGYCSMHRGDD